MINYKVNQIIPCVECLKKEKEIERLNKIIKVYQEVGKNRKEMSKVTGLLVTEVEKLIKMFQ